MTTRHAARFISDAPAAALFVCAKLVKAKARKGMASGVGV